MHYINKEIPIADYLALKQMFSDNTLGWKKFTDCIQPWANSGSEKKKSAPCFSRALRASIFCTALMYS